MAGFGGRFRIENGQVRSIVGDRVVGDRRLQQAGEDDMREIDLPIRRADDRRGPVQPRDRIGRQHEQGAGNRDQNRQHRQIRPRELNISYHGLRELQPKEPAEVVADLSYRLEGLTRLLENERKLNSDADMMRLLLSCLTKVCQCQSMPGQKNRILNAVRTSQYLTFLGTFLVTNNMAKNFAEISEILGESADLLKALLTLFPSVVHSVIMVQAFMEMTQKQAKQRWADDLPAHVDKKMKDFELARDMALESFKHRQMGNQRRTPDEDSLTPPDDFRQISMFPTMEDLDMEKLPFLRKNKKVGGYTNVDHYLDVQFRLLREDFICPLREGIVEYVDLQAAAQGGKRLKDIRVLHDVHIVRAVCLPSGLGHRLSFDTTGLERVRWEVSKRLIYGSLLCLSADNFRTLFFATVVNREPSELKKGMVDVMFELNLHEVSALPAETSFTVAETTAFFEAYRHVLRGLQTIGEDELPFQKYIVHCQNTVSEPVYLTMSTKYDLRPLADDTVQLREDRGLLGQGRNVAYRFRLQSKPAESVTVLNRQLWPDAALLGLDSTQYEALHHALTKEFCVIQGPPGTGKTYVGMKIVKALLHNRTCWDKTMDSAMLVVCYTNHALDQFLEGIISFFSGKLVRVGSQIHSEKLQRYSLTKLRQEFRHKRVDVDRMVQALTRLRFQGYEQMNDLKAEIDTLGLKIESAKREIPHEDFLEPYMLHHHYQSFENQRYLMRNMAQWDFVQQGQGARKVMAIPAWLGIDGILNNAEVAAADLMLLEQEFGEILDIEGDVQALEQQHKLDTDDTVDKNDRDKKERERKTRLAIERSSYLALDISSLDLGEGQDSDGFQLPRVQRQRLKRQLRIRITSDDRMTEEEERQVRDIWRLGQAQRWRLYRRWTHKLCQALQEGLREKERAYDEMARRHQETLMQEDKHILKTATVIGMTTTAAARYQSILQEVKPKIIVVEEAAEVLEGHVITTLNQECQHLILIGDHKQLRPNPTVYTLARKYNMELSLFERMINNDIKCNTLGWQHRMRPEIAALVKPIYPDLNNHESVLNYENVKGVSANLFFINHSQPETHDTETKSRSNKYEAEYLAQLCLYLLKQGYTASRITVLTTYSGQLFQLRKLMPKKGAFEGVRLTVVDNFQGEENDIILLSLVRSNSDGNIGFLKIENRVCVALSRAKIGLYIIGNFDMLAEHSDLWQNITTKAREAGKLGNTLKLYCQNHPQDQGLVIGSPKDFTNAPEGGCMKPCTARLDCGHVCTRLCHPYDQDHETYKCTKKCERTMSCKYNHKCQLKCYEECGKCHQRVQKEGPRCKHLIWMACYKDPQDVICQEDCKTVLECGHRCGNRCGMPHKCNEMLEHTWPCGHKGQIRCSVDEIDSCPGPCGQQLACGHRCEGSCSGCYGGRLHKRCKHKCTRVLVCGHQCQDTCSYCPPCDEKCENSCVHSSCTKRCGQPCVPCIEPCVWECPHHRCTKLCSEPCDRRKCNKPCLKRLEDCGHRCIGLCGEPCPNLCRVCDAKEVTDIFFGTEDEPDARFVQLEDCNHVLEVSGLDQWMETTTDDIEDSVQLKACPRCKKPIRHNLRYGKLIKTQLQGIETVKRKIQGQESKREPIIAKIQQMVCREMDQTCKDLKTEVLNAGDAKTLGGLNAMENQLKLLEETKKLKIEITRGLMQNSLTSRTGLKPLQKAVAEFESWIRVPRLVFSRQETLDAETEMKILSCWLSLVHYSQQKDLIPAKELQIMADLMQKLQDGLKYTQTLQDSMEQLLKKLKTLLPDSGLPGITMDEKKMILTAMELSSGHWFKCPKGHIYAIGECGGATMEARCPECKSTIGGTSHRLREDNSLASEMDGATHAAWSEMANMGNFRNDDLLNNL